MIEQLKNILSAEGAEISALLNILSKQEESKLHHIFGSPIANNQNTDDISIKFFALNALFIYIKNNPSYKKELTDAGINITALALKIHELANLLYAQKQTWEHYFYRVSYAVLADKATLLQEGTAPSTAKQFSDKVLQFYTQLAFPPQTTKEIQNREEQLQKLKSTFSAYQSPENITSQQQIFEIIALSNLVDIGEKVQHYILEGRGANIPTSIDSQVANAIIIFAEAGDRNWELICSLLRFVLHKYYKNSVWTHANRLPFFKNFIDKQIEQNSILLSLFPSQKKALQDILSTRKSTVISMPTSSGKTLLAELKILYTMQQNPDNCVCAYVVPTNALVNQTLKRLRSSLPHLKVEQLLPYNHFDTIEKNLLGEQTDILVSTPEKLNFLLKNKEASFIDHLRLIIIDEAHNISDVNRGSIWEFLLANLKQNDEHLSYLLLTPFIKNKEDLANWLGSGNSTSTSIEWTPTKQYIAYHSLHNNKKTSQINYLPSARNSIIKETVSIDLGINLQEQQQKINEKKLNDVVRNSILIEKYARQSGCILILHKGADSAEQLANKFAQHYNFLPQNNTTDTAYAKEVIRQELGEDHTLLDLLDKGIAFHHSQLPPLVKEALEDLVSNDAIKILIATTTLSQGMNFPIKTVVFETLTVGGGSSSKTLSYNDFWNIAGRAGRAYKDTEGHIVLGWKSGNKQTEENLKKLIHQDIEETVSSLTKFFDNLNGNEVINYQFIKNNPVAQNFLHYLNHLLNISYQYNLDRVTSQDITNILANSLYFKQNEFKEGFLESHQKIVNFSREYISSIKTKETSQLKLADTLGITDISLSTIIGIVTHQNTPLLSDCISQNNTNNLAIIINAINVIPELKIHLREQGQFNPELIARIMLGWINGRSISQISRANNLTTNECSGYIFSRLKNYIPWGMAIYQKISHDTNELLPSYAFYGVKDEKSVKLSYIGVPRFALQKVKSTITDDNLYQDMNELKSYIKKQNFDIEQSTTQNNIINKIIKKSIGLSND